MFLVQAFSSNTVDHVNDAIRTSYIGSHQLGAVDGYAVVAIDMNRRAASIGQARLLTPLLIAGRRPVLTSIQVVIATCYRPVPTLLFHLILPCSVTCSAAGFLIEAHPEISDCRG